MPWRGEIKLRLRGEPPGFEPRLAARDDFDADDRLLLPDDDAVDAPRRHRDLLHLHEVRVAPRAVPAAALFGRHRRRWVGQLPVGRAHDRGCRRPPVFCREKRRQQLDTTWRKNHRGVCGLGGIGLLVHVRGSGAGVLRGGHIAGGGKLRQVAALHDPPRPHGGLLARSLRLLRRGFGFLRRRRGRRRGAALRRSTGRRRARKGPRPPAEFGCLNVAGRGLRWRYAVCTRLNRPGKRRVVHMRPGGGRSGRSGGVVRRWVPLVLLRRRDAVAAVEGLRVPSQRCGPCRRRRRRSGRLMPRSGGTRGYRRRSWFAIYAFPVVRLGCRGAVGAVAGRQDRRASQRRGLRR
mmetsp:Transcript_26919/g.83300  ORF Transcript_26919/g.83300 Transcript_26919/m.83300 type:complete len:348 (+) Transcript_26919:405-1448(+)